jgi:outer membrane protein TolC
VKVGMLQYKNTLTGFWPTLSVSYNDATQQNDNKFEPFSTSGPFWYPARYWTLHASWMLFNGGSRYWTAKRSKVAWEEKRLLAENVCKQADINDENLRLAYKKAAALAANSKTVMDLSLDNYRHTCNRYVEGMATLEDRLNAFSDFINYQNQYLNNISDLLVQTYLVKIRQTEFK